MDGQSDGVEWMDDRCLDGWLSGWVGGSLDGCMHGKINE